MLTIIAFLFVLSVLVFVHEFGHYIVAKLSGIGVIRFSIGMPPRLFGIHVGETDYCISAIPFGGYVKLVGQDDFADEEDESEVGPRDYRGKSRPVQIAVLVAGSLMNLLTAAAIFTMLFWLHGVQVQTARIGYVEPGSYAAEIGFRPGDEVLSINGKAINQLDRSLMTLYTENNVTITVRNDGETRNLLSAKMVEQNRDLGMYQYIPAVVDGTLKDSPADKAGIKPGDEVAAIGDEKIEGGWYEMSSVVRAHPDTTLQFTVLRSGGTLTLPIRVDAIEEPRPDGGTETIGRIGVTPRIQVREIGFFPAVGRGFGETWFLVASTVDFLGKLVTGRLSAKMLGGPVLIAQMAGESARSGFTSLIFFTAFISVNLGVLNLLPFPVLDGGHIAIITVEGITRRKLSTRVRIAIQQAGSIFLILFMLYITFNDLLRIDTISRILGG